MKQRFRQILSSWTRSRGHRADRQGTGSDDQACHRPGDGRSHRGRPRGAGHHPGRGRPAVRRRQGAAAADRGRRLPLPGNLDGNTVDEQRGRLPGRCGSSAAAVHLAAGAGAARTSPGGQQIWTRGPATFSAVPIGLPARFRRPDLRPARAGQPDRLCGCGRQLDGLLAGPAVPGATHRRVHRRALGRAHFRPGTRRIRPRWMGQRQRRRRRGRTHLRPARIAKTVLE